LHFVENKTRLSEAFCYFSFVSTTQHQHNMKTYTLTITEDQAHAIGYALRNSIKEIKAKPEFAKDEYFQELVARLESSYTALDIAPEKEVAA